MTEAESIPTPEQLQELRQWAYGNLKQCAGDPQLAVQERRLTSASLCERHHYADIVVCVDRLLESLPYKAPPEEDD